MRFVMSTFKFSILMFLFLSLAACSHFSKKGADADDDAAGQEGAYSMGLGENDQFGNLHGKNSLNAPENQTYYFDFDKNEVHPDDRPAIEAQAKYIASHARARVRLEGHTDERGSREYNIALGERRALAVADVLKMNGVAEKQIKVVSYGEEKPASPGHDEESYRLNRRVELIYEGK